MSMTRWTANTCRLRMWEGGDTSNHTLVLSMFFFFFLRKKKAIPNLKELEIINLKAVPRIFDFFIGKWSHDILCDQAKNKF